MRILLRDVKEFCSKSKNERGAERTMIAKFNPNPAPYLANINSQSLTDHQMVTDLNLNDSHPKLKDFLPHMKPQSWGNKNAVAASGGGGFAKPNRGNIGPPVIDRTNLGMQQPSQ